MKVLRTLLIRGSGAALVDSIRISHEEVIIKDVVDVLIHGSHVDLEPEVRGQLSKLCLFFSYFLIMIIIVSLVFFKLCCIFLMLLIIL